MVSLSRAGRSHLIGWAVGTYITAGYWYTNSTSFVNPAVTGARMFSNTFAGIQPASVPMFLLAQVVGAAAGFGLGRVIYLRANPVAIIQENPHELEPTATAAPIAEQVGEPARGRVTDYDRLVAKPVPELLFVCVQNAGRSQMAVALAQHLSAGRCMSVLLAPPPQIKSTRWPFRSSPNAA
jgi:hypothetical protein